MTASFESELDDSSAEPAIDEPRGPHLPDALAAIPLGVLVFTILGLARMVWFVREADLGPAPSIATVLSFVSGLVPAVAAVLLPAAVLARHPDAWERARTLLVGTVLLAVVEGLRVLGPVLQPTFEQITPGNAETPFLVPLTIVYTSGSSLLSIFAIANVALGLGQARRYLDRSGARAILLGAGTIVVVVAGLRIVAFSQLRFDQIPMTPTVVGYLASSLVLSILSIVAWGYLLATVVRGAWAGDEPETSWSVAAIGIGLVTAAFGVNAVLTVIQATEENQAAFTTISQVISAAYALGWLAFVLALLLGLPSLEAIDDEPGDDDEGVDDEGDSGEGDGVTETDLEPGPVD
jgi:hypothetical protein